MKIPNKPELQRISFNHSSDIGFKDFMNLFRKKYCKNMFFLVNDNTLTSDNPLGFGYNLFRKN